MKDWTPTTTPPVTWSSALRWDDQFDGGVHGAVVDHLGADGNGDGAAPVGPEPGGTACGACWCRRATQVAVYGTGVSTTGALLADGGGGTRTTVGGERGPVVPGPNAVVW